MKSPQFSTWPTPGGSTNGGSVLGQMARVGGVNPGRLDESGVSLNGVGERRVFDVLGFDERERAQAEEHELAPMPAWKWIFDFVLIVVSAPITLPLGLVIAAWIKLVSRGPVFFRQERIGRGGQAFTILKFRSMSAGAPTVVHEDYLKQLISNGAPMAKLDGDGDQRIIAGGRCLRATGLDELPQLINVLRREMSLVGPRPSTVCEYALFTDEQKQRVDVLPGLTGYWQVSGKNKLTFQQMIELDLQYTCKMSLGMDLAIVVATLPAMFLQLMESRVRAQRVESADRDHPSSTGCEA